jgi:hypothetical protein
MTKRLLACALLLCGGLLSGCASMGVKPWQRGVLARDDMQVDSSPLDTAIDQHIYFSKEASSGGQGFGGGGCGCN